jgi:hypothetical protein
MDELPDWPDGTVAVLSTGAGAPHAIPVSLVRRAGPRSLVLGLAPRRESLARLREEPRCAVTILAPGHAFTAHGAAEVLDRTPAGIVAARVAVERIQDHRHDTFTMESGAAFRWTGQEAARRDAEARAALAEVPGRAASTLLRESE